MSDRQPKRRRANSEEITDLFRILRNMCRDKEVSDAHFRLAFRIAQGRNEDTGWAEASHDLLIDEVPRTQKGKLRGFRDVMRDELGWLRILPGQRGQGTMYQFRDERCAALESMSERKREERHAKSALNRIERITALKVAGLGVNPDPSSEPYPSELRGETLPPSDPGLGVNPLLIEGQISTPILPHSTTSTGSCRQQDETRDAHAPAPMPARAVPPPPEDDDWLDDLPQANSAPSEFRVSNSVRCNCGEPAICEIRLIGGGPFEPHCVECAEESLPIDVQPIPDG